jgi:hypothetical protein
MQRAAADVAEIAPNVLHDPRAPRARGGSAADGVIRRVIGKPAIGHAPVGQKRRCA